MAKEKEVCNAHELLLRNFTSIEEGQAKLYDLDREKADKLTVIEVSVARLEESANAGNGTNGGSGWAGAGGSVNLVLRYLTRLAPA